MNADAAASGGEIVRWLAELEVLRRLPQRYARAIDARDLDRVAELFWADGQVEGLRGRAAVPDYLEGLRAGAGPSGGSMHVLGDPLIELAPGSDAARMDTYAVVHQLGVAGGGHLELGIRYLDDLELRSGRWRILHRRTELLWRRETTDR